MDPTWTPTEDAITLLSERAWLVGAILTGVGYGVVVTLYCFCLRQLLKNKNRANPIQRNCLLIYTTTITIFATLCMAAYSRMAELSFVDFRAIPGGPSAFETFESSVPVDKLGNVAFVLGNWLADGLVVWRCMVIYRNCRLPSWIIVSIHSLVFLGSLTLGTLWLHQILSSASSPWLSTHSADFFHPYFWVAILLNLVLTLVIVARLVVFRWRVSASLGSQFGSQYTSIASILIESALVYSAAAIPFIVSESRNSPLANIFIQVLSQAQVIAPLLIIYRVASGDAWSSNATNQILARARIPIHQDDATQRSTSRLEIKLDIIRTGPTPDNVSTDAVASNEDHV